MKSTDTEYFVSSISVHKVFPGNVPSQINSGNLDIPVLKKHLEYFYRIEHSIAYGMDRCQMTFLQSPAQLDPTVMRGKSLADSNGFLTKTIMYS